MALTEVKPWPDPRYFAGAPTWRQAKKIYWRDLKQLVPWEWLARKPYETDLTIETAWGAELSVIGLDKPERVEGTPWDGCGLDEYADMRKDTWSSHVQPSLMDRHGWCWFLGVPEERDHYYDLNEMAKESKHKRWGSYSWPSADIVDPEELRLARETTDDVTFRREYEASFEDGSSYCYYKYSQLKHRARPVPLKRGLDILLACDFNVDPCVWEVCQSPSKRFLNVVDEIVQRGTSTEAMTREFIRRYPEHVAEKRVLVYGDAAGSNRTTTGMSDYAIMHQMGLRRQQLLRRNPFQKDRVAAVNSMLESASGIVSIAIDPKAEELSKDMLYVKWKDGTKEIDKSDPKRTHASDGLGYVIWKKWPLRRHSQVVARKY